MDEPAETPFTANAEAGALEPAPKTGPSKADQLREQAKQRVRDAAHDLVEKVAKQAAQKAVVAIAASPVGGWIAAIVVAVILIVLIVAIAAGLFAQKRHFGADLGGAVRLTQTTDKLVPAQAGRDKGQLVELNLDSIDTAITQAKAVVTAHPALGANGRVNALLDELKNLRRETESKAYANGEESARQLGRYRQILADLALALDPDVAGAQTTILARLDAGDGIALDEAHTCAPRRDIENLVVTGRLLAVMAGLADIAKANHLTAHVTCLVTGYRDLGRGDYPMCLNNPAANLPEREHDIAVHCAGRAADFGGDYLALSSVVGDQAAILKLAVVQVAGDHLHIEVTP